MKQSNGGASDNHLAIIAQPCEVCGGRNALVFCDRPSVPVHQHCLLRDQRAAEGVPRGHLRLACCQTCGFVFNAAFDSDLLDYNAGYDNSQSYSGTFEHYMDSLTDRILEQCPHEAVRFVEVGCGKGTFLRKLVERAGDRARGVGFDPTHVGPREELHGRLRFEHQFYDASAGNTSADVVICRHVIEHVQQPLQLLKNVRHALRESPHAAVYFETPCVHWILANRVVWDFFYEHCSLFTADSLRLCFERAAFDVRRVEHLFGGQYLWLEAACGETHESRPGPTRPMWDLAAEFARYELAAIDSWRTTLQRLRQDSAVALWGAGAKGVTLANLVDRERRLIDCVVDVNPAKQSQYLPGTGHPIIAPSQLGERRIGVVCVTNPNYLAEIKSQVQSIAPEVEVLNLMGDASNLRLP